jgi:autotransporter-associated beta strand protein
VAFNQGGGAYGMFVNVALPGGATNRMPLASLRTGPAVAGLEGGVGATVIITNTTLSVVITNNTTFGGTVAGNGVLRKLGAGTWTLNGTNTQTGNILSGGRLVHNGDVYLGGASSALTFDGGTLEIQDPTVLNLDTHPVNWPTFNGGIDVVNAATTLTVTNTLGQGSALGNFTKYGPGDLAFGGAVSLNRGHLRGGDTVLATGAPTVFQNFLSVGQAAGDFATAAVGGNGALVSSNDFNVGDLAGSTGIVTASGSAFLRARALYLGKNGNAAGALHLLGAGLTNYAGNGGDWRIGGGTGTNDALAYGYLRQTAGSSWCDRNFQIGAYGRGVFDLSGGTWTNFGSTPVVGRYPGARGVLHVSGGAFLYTNSGNRLIIGEQGYGVLNVAGTGRVTLPSGLSVGGFNTDMGTGVVNLAGGLIEASVVAQATGMSFGVFNFNGGTLRALANNATFMQGLDAAYVWPGGAVVDAGPYAITIAQDLLTPPGSGVSGLVLTNGGSGYIGPPLVVIEGGGGTGATAVAEVDLVAGVVTNVRVTCPGVNYGTAPAVTLVGGGGSGAGVGLPSLAANAGGGFVKLGSGSVKLTGTNTFAGNIVISNGVFLVGSTNITGGLELAGTNIGIGGAFNVDQSFLTWLSGKMVGSNPAQLAIGANTTNDLDLSAAPWAGLPIISGGGTESFSGGLTTGSTNLYLGGTAGTLVWARVIGTGTNVFIGWPGGATGGVVTLSGTNVGYASEINVLSGNLRVGITNGLGGAAARAIVADGAAIDMNGNYAGDLPIYVVGRGPHGNGAIVNTGGGTIPNAKFVHLTGDTTFGGPNRWDIRSATAGPLLNLAGYTLTKTNGNEIAAFNCEISDGNLTVGQGLFRFEQGTIVTAGVGRITVGAAGTLDFYNLTGICTRAITVTNGYVRAAAGNNFVGSPVTLAGQTNTFEPYAGATLVLTGVVDGAGALRKLNAGTLRLLRTEAYTGDTLVNAGVLSLEASDATLGTIGSANSLTINHGGTVRVTTNDGLFGTQPRPVLLNGGATLLSIGASARLTGALTMSGGALDGSAPDATRGNWKLEAVVSVLSNAAITASRVQLGVATGTVFDVATGQTLVASATFEDPELGAGGTGTLVKTGAGTLVITGTNSYRGATRVLAGTLRLQADAPPAGAALWLDANDVATIAADGAARVSAWSDKSGNARHATQTNATIQPTLITNAIPNRPVMRFAGGVQQMDVSLAFLANSPYTILGVEARTNTATTFMLGTRNGTANNGLHFGYRNNTAFTLAQYGNDLDAGIPGFTGQQFRVWNGTLDTAVGHSIFLNGTNVSNNANTTPFTGSIGAGVVGNGYAAQNFHGDVGEILVYNRALGAADRKIAETYLANKWLGGAVLTDLLPAASPLQLAAAGRLDLGGVRQTVGSLSDYAGAGGLVLNNASGAAVLIVGHDGADAAFSGVIQDGTGLVAVVKTGAGTQSLHGLNSFGGETTISNGTLLVNGLIGTGAVSVAAGGVLGGTGVVLGAVSSAGMLAPGVEVGTLTVSNDYQQSGALFIQLAGTSPGTGHDVLQVSGTASLGGSLLVSTNGGFTPVAGQSFTVLTAGAVSGTFGSTGLPALPTGLGWEVAYPGAAVVLSVTGTVASATPYDLWAQSITNPALRGEQEDADGDGSPNLLEYSQGSDATNAADSAKLMLVRSNGQFLAVFNRVNTATDIVYEVEGAYAPTNGASWLGIATNAIGSWGSSTNVNDDNTAAVHRVLVTDLELGTNRTLRLKITRP